MSACIKIDGQYGGLVVKSVIGKDKHGHKLYEYQCDCGRIGYGISSFLLGRKNIRCKKCAEKEIGIKRRVPMLGRLINGWEIKEKAGKNKYGALLFKCRCLKCGAEAIKSGGTVRNIKASQCIKCPPEYNFKLQDSFAYGTLPDGTGFLIDADMVSVISQYFWRKNEKGYITSQKRGEAKKNLHRLILGGEGDIIVDHINRDKTDNRRANLRIVNYAQNASNKSLQKNNTTGYVGVSWVAKRNSYMAKIGSFDKDLTLGLYKQPEKAAAAYNIGARFLFGEYIGHINNVPELDCDCIADIEAKCERFVQKHGKESRKRGNHIYGERRNETRRRPSRRGQTEEAAAR